jgi:hypothetical protein
MTSICLSGRNPIFPQSFFWPNVCQPNYFHTWEPFLVLHLFLKNICRTGILPTQSLVVTVINLPIIFEWFHLDNYNYNDIAASWLTCLLTKCLSAKLFSIKRHETFPGPTSFDQITIELKALCQDNILWTLIGQHVCPFWSNVCQPNCLCPIEPFLVLYLFLKNVSPTGILPTQILVVTAIILPITCKWFHLDNHNYNWHNNQSVDMSFDKRPACQMVFNQKTCNLPQFHVFWAKNNWPKDIWSTQSLDQQKFRQKLVGRGTNFRQVSRLTKC